MKTMILKILGTVGTLLLLLFYLTAIAQAQYFTPVPNIFVNGQTGDATQANANFSQLVAQGNTAVNTMQTQINGFAVSGVPVGAVMWVSNTVCPTGWLIANGGASVPDLRGVYVRGIDTSALIDPGRTIGSYQADSFVQHSHGSISGLSGITALPQSGSAGSGGVVPAVAGGTNSITASLYQFAGGGYETRPPTVVYLPCYKSTAGGGSTGASYFSASPVNLSAYSTIPPAIPVNKNYSQIVADGNIAFASIQAQITAFSGGGTVPSGAVVPFSATSCPSGWHQSDGTAGTPDMRGRFGIAGTQGGIGGSLVDNIAAHIHQVGPMPTYATGANAGSIHFQGSGGTLHYAPTASSGGGSVGNATNGNVGTETRPKNIALLYCSKS